MPIAAGAALFIAACGGSGPTVTTERPPITTTIAPTDSSTAAPPTTTRSANGSETPLSTIAEILPDSIGTSVDPAVDLVPPGATRYYFAGEDATGSVRPNVLGDNQVLYYDVYPPNGSATGLTAIYLHGGGLDLGYANSEESVAACRQFAQLGAWCVSVEYRRGFAGFAAAPQIGLELTSSQGERYRQAAMEARNDALEAWFHLDANAETLGLPPRYVLVGVDSGSSLASDIALATQGLPYEIAGAILSSGTHSGSVAGATAFPVVLQGGLLDSVTPAYSNNLHFDSDMPIVIGVVNLYERLVADASVARLYLNAQDDHGYGGFQDASGSVSYFADAIALFASPEPSGAFIQFRFSCDDSNFGAAGPGVRIDTLQFPEFRYDPIQSDLQAGLSPDESLLLHPLESTSCEG